MPDKTVPSLPDAALPLAGTEYLYLVQAGADKRLLLQSLLNAVRVGRQQCQLILSGANLLLRPFDGNIVTINTQSITVPDAGVTLAPAGLTVNQLYYIYAWMSGTTLTLEASPTAPAVQAGTGVKIKSGDATRTLVGMARPVTGPAFQDSAINAGVRSYYNRRPRVLTRAFTIERTGFSGVFAEIHSEIRINALLWADDQAIVAANGYFYTGDATHYSYACCGMDSVASPSFAQSFSGTGSSIGLVNMFGGVTEGLHYFTLMGRTDGPSVGFTMGTSLVVTIIAG